MSRHEHLPVFEQAFDLFWRNPQLLEKLIAALLPTVFGRGGEAAPAPELPARIAQAMLPPRGLDRRERDDDEIELDAAFTMSPREVLQHKDFETMTAEELAAVRAMLRELRLPLPELPTRRTAPVAPRASRSTCARRCGARPAPRARCRRSRGAGAQRRTPPLVVLCDISGSMDRYARMLLHFLHAITNDRDRVHVLLFGTRLTNITRAPEASRRRRRARARRRRAVSDWAGGTRIGSCLEEFNRRWSRRLLGQNAVVLLISDGLDADAGDGSRPADGAAAQVLPAARLAQSAAALRRLRGAPGGHQGDAAARRRFPAGAQSRRA